MKKIFTLFIASIIFSCIYAHDADPYVKNRKGIFEFILGWQR